MFGRRRAVAPTIDVVDPVLADGDVWRLAEALGQLSEISIRYDGESDGSILRGSEQPLKFRRRRARVVVPATTGSGAGPADASAKARWRRGVAR